MAKKKQPKVVVCVESLENITQQIAETLQEADGEFVTEIANRVLTNKVKYIGDSMFEQFFTS